MKEGGEGEDLGEEGEGEEEDLEIVWDKILQDKILKKKKWKRDGEVMEDRGEGDFEGKDLEDFERGNVMGT